MNDTTISTLINPAIVIICSTILFFISRSVNKFLKRFNSWSTSIPQMEKDIKDLQNNQNNYIEKEDYKKFNERVITKMDSYEHKLESKVNQILDVITKGKQLQN